MKKILFSLLLSTFMFGCAEKPYYLSPSFKTKAQTHKTVAVLPFEVITNGTLPKDMTADRKKQIEEQETVAFQQSLYNGLTNNLGRNRIQIQLPNKTNNILKSKGISISQISQRNPEELAKMLGVDAVVYATVTKYRYLDDKASMGIDLGNQALSSVTRGQSNAYTKDISSKTNDVKVTCTLVNAVDGDVLWKINDDKSANWSKNTNTVIDGLNEKLAVNFPYKFLRN
jgi:hypothetical protein